AAADVDALPGELLAQQLLQLAGQHGGQASQGLREGASEEKYELRGGRVTRIGRWSASLLSRRVDPARRCGGFRRLFRRAPGEGSPPQAVAAGTTGGISVMAGPARAYFRQGGGPRRFTGPAPNPQASRGVP